MENLNRSQVIIGSILVIFILTVGVSIHSLFSLIVITGDSMNPELHHHDIVVVIDNPQTIEVGDTIAVPSGRNFSMVHEVVAVSDSTVQTKGVNNSYKDPPKTRDEVRGKVIYSISLPDIVKNTVIEPLHPDTYEEIEDRSDLKKY